MENSLLSGNTDYINEKTDKSNINWKEKLLELKMITPINLIYMNIFKNCVIKRPSSSNINNLYSQLDKIHGIDTYIHLHNGSPLSVQEKVLRHSKQKYNHLTWEYMNNPNKHPSASTTQDRGEWFKGLAQLIFFAYANEEENDIERWYILDVARLRINLAMDYSSIHGCSFTNYNPAPALASFLCIDWSLIEQEYNDCILFSSKKEEIASRDLKQN